MDFEHLVAPILLSVLVVVAGLFLFFFNNKKEKQSQVQAANSVFQLKLQACERLILFLERNKLASILNRFNANETTASQLEQTLVQTIRQEFDHNITQQLYVSETTWAVINHAVQTHITLIHGVGKTLSYQDSGQLLAQTLLSEQVLSVANNAADMAISEIKNELGFFKK